jgi:2-methylcitrate dehydratase PrpD
MKAIPQMRGHSPTIVGLRGPHAERQASSMKPELTTIAEHLASWSSSIQYRDVPQPIVRELEWHALDTMGVLIGATPLGYARTLAALAVQDGGFGEATLFGSGHKVPARAAAFVNGCLGHGIDWDDTHLDALLHPTATILPAVLAIAEARGASGSRMLAALAIGVEAMIRVGLASGHGLVRRGLHPTSMCGTFGVALATAWMFNLNRDQTVHALGIAGGMCAGLHESVIDGSMNKCIHSGVAVQAGYAAAELAASGFTGPATIFEGRKGYLNAFVGDAGFDQDPITRALGVDWHAGRLAYKAYACCQGAHPYADTALALFHEHGVRAADVEGVTVKVGEKVGRSLCEPQDVKQHPPSAYGAKFSIPFVVASALTDGTVDLKSFSDTTIAQVDRLELAARVSHVVDRYYDVGMALRGYVAVKLKNGREIVAKTEACAGTPENPWSAQRIIAKFRLLSEPIIGVNRADQLVSLLPALHTLERVNPLLAQVANSCTVNSGSPG